MATTEERILDIKVRYDDAITAITQYQKAIEDLKAREQELKREFKTGQIEEAAYRKEMEAVRAQTTAYSDEVRVLRREVQNNIKDQRAQEGSLKQLRAQLSNATKAYDEMSKAERESAKGQELKSHIKEITQELKGCEEETDRFYRNVGNYKQSIIEALGGNTKFGSSIMGLAQSSEEAGGMFKALAGNVSAFGKALMGLMANPVFLAIAGIAGAGIAFKALYDYNKDIAEATRLTREFLNVDGEGLQAIRNDIQASADTFGKEYTEVLQAVDTLMAQFGVSADEALKIINDGFAAGADFSGDFLSKLGEFSPKLHDAGLQADELVALLAQTRSGIFSDKGLDIIGNAGERLREMTNSTAEALQAIGINSADLQKQLADGSLSMFDAIQQVSQRMQELPSQSQAVGQVLADVFQSGADAGMSQVEALAEVSTNLEEVKEQTGEYGKAIDAQRQAQGELNDAVSALFDLSGKGFEEMTVNIKTTVIQWTTQFVRAIVDAVNWFIRLYNNSLMVRAAVANIVATFKTAFTTIKGIIEAALNAVRSFGQVVEDVLTLNWGAVSGHWKQGMQNLANIVAKTVGAAVNNVRDAIDMTANGHLEELNYNPSASGIGGTSGGSNVRTGSGGRAGGGSASAGKSANDAAKQATERAKAEREAVQKAEELMIKLLGDTMEARRKQIAFQYDKQIAEVRLKLEETSKTETKTINALNAQIVYLEKLKNQDLAKLSLEFTKKEVERTQRRIELELAVAEQGSAAWLSAETAKIDLAQQLAEQQLATEVMTEQEREAMLTAMRAKYDKERADVQRQADEQAAKEQSERLKAYFAERLQATADNEVEQARVMLEQRQVELAQLTQQQDESDAAFRQRQIEAQNNYVAAQEELAAKEQAVAEAKATGIANAMGGISKAFDALGEENEAFAKLSKVLALGEIAVNTGKAIAAGVAQAQSVPFPGNIAAIGTTVATVLSNIATAISTVKSAKFATGGLVKGAGTGTSDSITARVSNGESVMTAQATSMFAPVLSALNQIGGGVPIVLTQQQSAGVDVLAAAFAKGAQAIRPVVSVEEISRTNSRVQSVENNSVL